jgi:uncharacterized NAD(P)/FAD-binding protein YdhS
VNTPETTGTADGARAAIALIGAGPRGTSVLERIAANAAECLPHTRLDVHVIDPYPPGGGRVWRDDQPALLWSNTRADECTLFTDDTVQCEGPVAPGPTLEQWAARMARAELDLPHGYVPRPDSLREAARAHGGWFATRSLIGDYLAWVFHRVAEAAAPRVRVRFHQARAVDLQDLPTGRQRVTLDDAGTIDVDLVVQAQGNIPVAPRPEEERLARTAAIRRLVYVPPSSAADISLDAVPAGEPVIVRGLGLAFVDTMVLLTEGRGGRFVRDASGRLRYAASGREPVLYAGSRRGVPYRCKFAYGLSTPPSDEPRYFRLTSLGDGPLDFTADLWPLIAREVTEAGYRELAASHPERLAVAPERLLAGLAAADWDTPAFKELIERAVPDNADRVDVESPDRPLTGRRFPDHAALQRWMTGYLAADLRRGRDPGHSAHLAVHHALFTVMNTLWDVVRDGRITPGSGDRGLPSFLSMCRFLTSGPPSARLEQLLALARAGIVRFLGAGIDVTFQDGEFQARSGSVEAVVRARALIEARLPRRAMSLTTDPLLVRLAERGAVREEVHIDPATGRRYPTGVMDTRNGHPVRDDGTPHRGRLVTYPGDFPRPRANSPFLRQSDALARQTLSLLVSSGRTVG